MTSNITKTVSLYGGDIVVKFSNTARNRYVLADGTSPLGVTTILGEVIAKKALMTWPMYEAITWLQSNPYDWEGAAKAYTIKSDVGKTTGTSVHEAAERLLRDKSVKYTSETKKPLTALSKWLEMYTPRVISTEQIIYSKIHSYAGTYDALLEIDGVTTLIDFKTNNASKSAPSGIYPEMFVQLGAYSLAAHEEHKRLGIQDLAIIRLGKDGKLNYLTASDVGLSVRDCEEAWLHTLGLYKFLAPLSKRLEGT